MAYVEVVEINDVNNGLNGDFGFFPMPKIEGEAGNQEKTFGAPEGMIVNAKSQHVEESVDFLKYLTSLEVQKKLVEEAKHTSSVIGATTEENAIPQLVEVMDMIMNFQGMSNWTDCGLEASIVDVMRAQGQEFYAGDGIVTRGIEATIHNVGRLGRDGMRETNEEIIKMMIDE